MSCVGRGAVRTPIGCRLPCWIMHAECKRAPSSLPNGTSKRSNGWPQQAHLVVVIIHREATYQTRASSPAPLGSVDTNAMKSLRMPLRIASVKAPRLLILSRSINSSRFVEFPQQSALGSRHFSRSRCPNAMALQMKWQPQNVPLRQWSREYPKSDGRAQRSRCGGPVYFSKPRP